MRCRGMMVLLAFGLGLWTCSRSPRTPVPENPPVRVNGEWMILGPTRYTDILQQFPRWQAADRQVVIDSADIVRLKAIRSHVDILCFLGTWCSDSRAGVPPFVGALEQAANPHLKLRLIGVDRDKADPGQMAQRYHIRRVPTFVILKNGQEIGRMVEYPRTTSFLRDFLNILERNR